jgi:hypothetical protein
MGLSEGRECDRVGIMFISNAKFKIFRSEPFGFALKPRSLQVG